MGQKIVRQLLPALPQMKWPANPHATPLGAQMFAAALREADNFADDREPRPLATALRALQTGDSRPYAYAGIAYVLITASRENAGSHHQPGLDAALQWIEKAQEMEPDLIDINVLEGFVYIYSDRLADARLILDYLANLDPHHPLLLRAEIAYWAQQQDIPQTVRAFHALMDQTNTGLLRMALNTQLADFYASVGEWDKAIAVYQKSAGIQQEDARLWHKLSLAYLATDNLDAAETANDRALSLANLAAAKETQEEIRARKRNTGFLRNLLNR